MFITLFTNENDNYGANDSSNGNVKSKNSIQYKKKCYVIRIFFLFIIKLSILIAIQVRYNPIEIRLCGLVVCCFVRKSLALWSFFPKNVIIGVGNKYEKVNFYWCKIVTAEN